MQTFARSAAVSLLLFTAVVNPNAHGQESRGTITGLVTDASGGAVPGAGVQVTNIGANISTQLVTNANGNFRLPSLHPRQYSAGVHELGFSSYAGNGPE